MQTLTKGNRKMKQSDNVNITPATHVLYRSDFRDSSMWDWFLEAHGIHQSEEDDVVYDEITIRATVVGWDD